jgi:hypothetical protein
MRNTIHINTTSTQFEHAFYALMKAGNYSFNVVNPEEDNNAQLLTWEDLTADDYRQMIRLHTPTLKAKSLTGYEE